MSINIQGNGPEVVEVAKHASKWNAIAGMVTNVAALALVAFIIHTCAGAP